MIATAVFAAWLVFPWKDVQPIPFASFDACLVAREEIFAAGWNRPVCIHGKITGPGGE